MNEQNLAYLKDSLKYMGFGDQLSAALEKNMQQGFPEFVLKLDTQINQQSFSALLHFKRPENSNLYFFNRWDATLKNEGGKWEQSFYLNKGQGITLKEGFNLMEGRAVHKELTNKQGEKYSAWLQLNFNERDTNGNYKVQQYHQHYGFDLEKALKQYPIKELGGESQRDLLLRSLNKGNVAAVTLEHSGRIEKLFVEATPKFKTLQFYDTHLQKLPHASLAQRFGVGEEHTEKAKAQKEESLQEKSTGKKQEADQKKEPEVTLMGKAIESPTGKKSRLSH